MKKLKIFGVAFYWYLIILAIVLIFVIVVWSNSRRLKASELKKEPAPDRMDEVKQLIDTVYGDLDETTRMIILAQAAHETAGFTSDVFVRNNNLFGMREALHRDYKGMGDIDEDGYMNYKSLKQSVEDHRLWMEYNDLTQNYLNVASYVATIKKKGYFEASLTSYSTAVNKWFYNIKRQYET